MATFQSFPSGCFGIWKFGRLDVPKSQRLLTSSFASNLWAKPDADADENADEASTCVGNPCTGHMGRCKFWMSMVQSKGDSNSIAKAMDKGIEELAKKKVPQLKRPVDQQVGTVGLSELDPGPRTRGFSHLSHQKNGAKDRATITEHGS
jgi:hypothetical protein